MEAKRKTKIVVTLGRNSTSKEMLVQLIRSGMDIARISNRFLTIDRKEVLKNLKEAVELTGVQVGVMLGLRESDMRLYSFDTDSVLELKEGDLVKVVTSSDLNLEGNVIRCNNKEFPDLVKPGDKLLIDFGKVEFSVVSVESITHIMSKTLIDLQALNTTLWNFNRQLNCRQELSFEVPRIPKSNSYNAIQRPKRKHPKSPKFPKVVLCRVETDCLFTAHKPVHICPVNSKETPISYATDIEDIKAIEWAAQNSIDFVVYKQVRDAEDLSTLLNFYLPQTKRFVGIQNKNSVDIMEEIITEGDGVVVGRGMLALETSLPQVFRIQKTIVKRCNELAKPVVISTQLLESMVSNSRPSRSEVTDITNAVLDGCDALILTGETAYGENPVRALEACSKICIEAERYLDYQKHLDYILRTLGSNISVAENICYCAVRSVLSLKAALIVCTTESGKTAQIISRFLPPCPILALTNSQRVLRQLKIVRGVFPSFLENPSEVLQRTFEIAGEFAVSGDILVFVGGSHNEFCQGKTCSFKILCMP